MYSADLSIRSNHNLFFEPMSQITYQAVYRHKHIEDGKPQNYTCKPYKMTNLQNLAKNPKRSGDSVKKLEILAGHFFRSDKFREHFK